MKRQILASMNEICDELENLGMIKAASEVTEMMVRLSQNKTWSWEQLQFGAEYDRARNEATAAGLKKDLDPETFRLVQDYLKDLYKKKKISKIMTPGEIGRWMVKNPVDKNELRNLMKVENRTKSIFETNPPPGTRVEFDKTEGMTDDELVIDYVALTRRAFEKNDLDQVGYWEDKAQENLSPEAYEKFSKIDEKMHDQFSNYYSEHPEAAEKLRTYKPGTSGTSTTPGVNSGLDRWVNKAENIYKAWSDKNMPENSTAPLLIKDVMNYMIKVKNSLPEEKLADAQAKIDKVQSFIDNINNKVKHTGSVAAYSTMTGFGKKESDVFGGQKMDEKKLDYLAKQEAKTY